MTEVGEILVEKIWRNEVVESRRIEEEILGRDFRRETMDRIVEHGGIYVEVSHMPWGRNHVN